MKKVTYFHNSTRKGLMLMAFGEHSAGYENDPDNPTIVTLSLPLMFAEPLHGFTTNKTTSRMEHKQDFIALGYDMLHLLAYSSNIVLHSWVPGR
jgi:hypothetical protein